MKILFIVVVIAYLAGGVISLSYSMYTELNSADATFRRLLFLNMCFTIALVIVFIYLVKRAIPGYVKREKTGWKVFRIVVFAIASFFINQGYMKIINCKVGLQTPVIIKGKITEKEVKEWSRRRRKRSRYFLTVEDSLSGQLFRFKVKRPAYLLHEYIDTFNKEMYIGSLGIIYRNEP